MKKADSELSFPGASKISILLSIKDLYIYHISGLAASELCGIKCITKRTGKNLIAARAINSVGNTLIAETGLCFEN